jgi:sulfate permease, SulP family
MALIGFMEATSISRALAAKSREKLDPNQELIGQGLANIVGSFFQSFVVSGSFSRSAVAAKSGARTGFFAIVSALGVVVMMLFMTQYFYHLPQPVLAAIVMSAVFGLIDFKSAAPRLERAQKRRRRRAASPSLRRC